MKKIITLFLLSMIASNIAYSAEKKIKVSRKPSSDEFVAKGISAWRGLLKCGDQITTKEAYLACARNFASENNNQRNFKKVIGFAATKYPEVRNFRECSEEDLKNFPFYEEQNFDLLICFDFTLGDMKKTLFSYLEQGSDKILIKNLEY